MKLTALRSAILLSLIPTTSVIAGGLDRSGQSMSAFFQSGNYAEAGFTVIDPTVEGTSTVVKDEKISDMVITTSLLQRLKYSQPIIFH